MNRPSYSTWATLCFLFVVALTFPFHYLKDWVFTQVSVLSRNSVQLYAQDLGVGFGGLKFSKVSVSIDPFLLPMESLTMRPSLVALIHGALGVSFKAQGVWGTSAVVHVGRSFRAVYTGINSDPIEMVRLPWIERQLPSLQGTLEVDGGIKWDSFAPLRGNGELTVHAPTLALSKPTAIQGIPLPAVPPLKPGLKGTVLFQANKLLVRALQIGAKGQALFALVDGTITVDNYFPGSTLSLAVEITFGSPLKEDPSLQQLLPMLKSFETSADSYAFQLSGTLMSPVVLPKS